MAKPLFDGMTERKETASGTSIAHDFNNLLQVIMGNLELLQRTLARHPSSGQPSQAWSTPIEAALRAAREAAQLTEHLLAFSRLERVAPATLEAHALIADMLLNVVADARNGVSGSGRLTIETQNVEVTAPSAEDISPGQYVLLTVADSGRGTAVKLYLPRSPAD